MIAADFLDHETVAGLLVEAGGWWMRDPRMGPGRVRSSWPRETVDLFADLWGRSDPAESTEAPRPLPLSREQIAQRDMRSDWLVLIADEEARRIVAVVSHVRALGVAHGRERIDWKRVMRLLRVRRDKARIERLYAKGIEAICRALNARAA